jgi:uncharacterized protein (TIGR03083 family)
MTEVQERYRQVASGFGAVVSATSPDQWDTQTPCAEWKARDLVAHLVAGHQGVIVGIRGAEAVPLGEA